MRVLKNFFWNAGYQVFILLVPLVSVPYVNRVLGPTGIGINAFTNSIVQYFIIIGGLGINIYGNREIAYCRDDKVAMSQKFWELVILRAVTVGISCVAYLTFIGFSSHYKLYFVAQGLLLVGSIFDISWLFQGLEDFKVTVMRNAIVKIASLVLIFLLVKDKSDVLIYIYILSGSQLIGFLTLWPYVRKLIRRPNLIDLNIKQHILPAVALLVPQMSIQIYLQLNKTMLGLLKGVEAAGFYDNSDKIVKMVLAVVTASGTVLLPYVAHNYSQGNKKAILHSLEISAHLMLAIAVPMAFGLSAIAIPFSKIFFGPGFSQVGLLMEVESFVIVAICIGSIIGEQYLLPTNQVKIYTLSIVSGSMVNIVLNIPLIIAFGTMGAIISTVLSEIMVSSIQLFKVRKQLNIKVLLSGNWKYIVAGVIMYLVLRRFVNQMTLTVWKLVLVVIIGAIIYFSVLVCLRPKNLLRYFSEFVGTRR